MRIRAKFVLVVLPIVVVAIVLVAAVSYFSASTGINRLARDFLGFKSGELEKFAVSEWALVDETLQAGGIPGLSEDELISATQESIRGFARSILRGETGRIFAVDSQGRVVLDALGAEADSDADAPTPDEAEQTVLSTFYEELPAGLIEFNVGGVSRVGTGFRFEPFDWYFITSDTSEAFYRDLTTLTVRAAVMLAVSVLLISLLLLSFASALTRPLGQVADSMERVIRENALSERVEPEYDDETGQLAQTFNVMLQQLDHAQQLVKQEATSAVLARRRERRLRSVFQKYVPAEVVDSVSDSEETVLEPVARAACVLSSDIRGFTTISSSMHPEDLVNSLNRYFELMVAPILRRDAFIDKYIGDAIIAVFGGGRNPAPDFHVQSVEAALDMVDAIEAFNADQNRRGLPEFHHGVGVNYGAVTIGNVGTQRKMDYTVIGPNADFASTLEALTKDYGEPLIISESLQRKIDGRYPWRLLDMVATRDRPDGIRIYSVSRMLNVTEQEAWGLHNQAMTAYFNKQFRQAIGLLNKVSGILPRDRAAFLIRERCEQLINDGEPAGWTGAAGAGGH